MSITTHTTVGQVISQAEKWVRLYLKTLLLLGHPQGM